MALLHKQLDRTPFTYDSRRRKFLLDFKAYKRPLPGVPSYLIDEDKDPIVFGSDRILVRKTKQA